MLRTDEGRLSVEPASFELDDDSDHTVRAMLAAGATRRRKVLAVVDGGSTHARLRDDPRLDVTVVAADALSSVGRETFDAAFVNGSIESTNPLGVMRAVRNAVRPGADVVVVVAASTIRQPRIPPYSFSAAPLTRLTLAADLHPRSCGIISRSIDTTIRDERLAVSAIPFERVARLFEAVGKRVEVPSGLLAMHARAEPLPARRKLSIIMPVFNEAKTFLDMFEQVYAAHVGDVDREIVLVESNSTDGSRELVQKVADRPDVIAIYEERPLGKGHAVRAGIEASTGEFILIQDADSEYDVGDYDIVLGPLLDLSATFVLGSRHLGGGTWKIREFANQRVLSYVMNLAHESFTALTNGLYSTEMRDPTTMYKVFRRDAYEGIRFTRDRFDFDWELVCKLVRRGHMPVEVPVNYRSRSYAEGKKVRLFRDPLTWLETIVASRFEALGEDTTP
ncbi:MAG TPA: glycosyltransferase family 2 protein [Polyangiaceae bacterium]|nr:glycosyltransferase family 2 protein [Polyangiaceae bacterium]